MEKDTNGKNQSYARLINNRLIINALEEEPCSATTLSKKLKLSNASLTAILHNLVLNGFIKEVNNDSNQARGRKQVFYSINANFGFIVVIDMSDYVAKLVISDMLGNFLDTAEIKVQKYDLAMLYELVLLIKDKISKRKYDGIPLLGIDIAVPGRVSAKTGELELSPQFDCDLFSNGKTISKFVNEKFNVPVRINNDINMALFGEANCGFLKDERDALIAHIDIGIGGAFRLDNNLYLGSHGYAGELGMMRTFFNGSYETLDEFVSIRGICKELSSKLQLNITFENLINYYENDERVKNYILETAKCLGDVLKDIAELLDLSVIVLTGKIKQFGNDYLDVVSKRLSYSRNNAQVKFSDNNNAVILGLIHKSIDSLTDYQLATRKLPL